MSLTWEEISRKSERSHKVIFFLERHILGESMGYFKEGIYFISKLVLWCLPIFLFSQLVHESGHMWAGLIAGYKIHYMIITLKGSKVHMTITSESMLLYKIVLFAGGFTSTSILSLLYTQIKDFGAEFSIVLLSFIQIEACVALIESLFTSFYKTNSIYMDLLVFPAFFIAVYIHQRPTTFQIDVT